MIKLLFQIAMLSLLLAGIFWITIAGWHVLRTPISLEVPSGSEAIETRNRWFPEPRASSIAEFSETLKRPLFFEERRFPPPRQKQAEAKPARPSPKPRAAAPPPKPAALPEKTKLLGVILHAGDKRALIETGLQSAVWLKLGDAIGVWTISQIENNRVLLKTNKDLAVLELYTEPKPNNLP